MAGAMQPATGVGPRNVRAVKGADASASTVVRRSSP